MTRNNKKANAHILRAAELMSNLSLGNNREGFGMQNVQVPGPDQAPVVEDPAGVQAPRLARQIVQGVVNLHDAARDGAIRAAGDLADPLVQIAGAAHVAAGAAITASSAAARNAMDQIFSNDWVKQHTVVGECPVCIDRIYTWQRKSTVTCDAGCASDLTKYHKDCFLKWCFHRQDEDGNRPNMNKCMICDITPCIPFSQFKKLCEGMYPWDQREHLLATEAAKNQISDQRYDDPQVTFLNFQDLKRSLRRFERIESALIGSSEGSNFSENIIRSAGQTIEFRDCDFRCAMQRCTFEIISFIGCKFKFIGRKTRSTRHPQNVDGFRVNSFAGSKFYMVLFHKCKFSTAEFNNASFINCTFTECRFHNNCSFKKTSFDRCTFEDVQVNDANLDECVINYSGLNNCYFLSVSWKSAKIQNSQMTRCSFRATPGVDGAPVRVTSLNQCNLTSSKFLKTVIRLCDFHTVTLDKSRFESCYIHDAQFGNSTLTDVVFQDTLSDACILSEQQRRDIKEVYTNAGQGRAVARGAANIMQGRNRIPVTTWPYIHPFA